MITTNTLLSLCSICLVIFTFMVIVTKQPVFSIVFLSASFVCSCFLLFLLECEFLALLFLIIYLGAILILFLFAIMMLESKLNNLTKNKIKYIPMGLFFSFFLFIPFINIDLSFIFNNVIDYNFLYLNVYQN